MKSCKKAAHRIKNNKIIKNNQRYELNYNRIKMTEQNLQYQSTYAKTVEVEK